MILSRVYRRRLAREAECSRSDATPSLICEAKLQPLQGYLAHKIHPPP